MGDQRDVRIAETGQACGAVADRSAGCPPGGRKTVCAHGARLPNLSRMSFTCHAPQFFIRFRHNPALGR